MRTLTSITLLALLLAGVFTLVSFLTMNAGTGMQMWPTSQAQIVWSTTWQRDDAPVQFRSALSTGDGEAPPVIVGQTVYALGSDRQLHAIDVQSGKELWRFDAGGGRRVFNFRVSATRLVLLARAQNQATTLADSYVVGINPSTRTLAWDQPLGTDVYVDSLEVDSDSAYIGVADNIVSTFWRALRDRGAAPTLHPRVRAYALGDGVLRWEQPLPERNDVTPADEVVFTLIGRELVVTESLRGTVIGLVALDRTSGPVLWRDLNGSQALGSFRGQLLARSGGDLVILLPATGKQVDRLVGLAPPRGSDATLVSGPVLYSTGSDTVRAIDLDGRAGLWSPIELDAPKERSAGVRMRRPGVQAGHLLVGGRDQAVYSILAQSGSVEWKFIASTPKTPSTDYAPLLAGKLVLVQDGQLTAYRSPR
jgi:outer membrane protein assembly factor BamB